MRVTAAEFLAVLVKRWTPSTTPTQIWPNGRGASLRVECTKCDRKGRYSVAKLIEKQAFPKVWCHNCGAEQPVEIAVMKADEHSDHDAADLCGICRFVVATLHA
jgi:hypothetical protein